MKKTVRTRIGLSVEHIRVLTKELEQVQGGRILGPASQGNYTASVAVGRTCANTN
jgi:hypothetical protein